MKYWHKFLVWFWRRKFYALYPRAAKEQVSAIELKLRNVSGDIPDHVFYKEAYKLGKSIEKLVKIVGPKNVLNALKQTV